MDTDVLVARLRALRTTPSRRALTTAVVALAVRTPLASLVSQDWVEAKGKGHKHKKKKKKKKIEPPPCALGQAQCATAGNHCCDPALCSACGCCPATQPACCGDAAAGNHFCYDPTAETCCPTTVTGIAGACPIQPPLTTFCSTGAGGTVPTCCPSGSERCGAGCCPPGTFCCADRITCCVEVTCNPAIGACTTAPLGMLARTQ
jgi:hypothetical protein